MRRFVSPCFLKHGKDYNSHPLTQWKTLTSLYVQCLGRWPCFHNGVVAVAADDSNDTLMDLGSDCSSDIDDS